MALTLGDVELTRLLMNPIISRHRATSARIQHFAMLGLGAMAALAACTVTPNRSGDSTVVLDGSVVATSDGSKTPGLDSGESPDAFVAIAPDAYIAPDAAVVVEQPKPDAAAPTPDTGASQVDAGGPSGPGCYQSQLGTDQEIAFVAYDTSQYGYHEPLARSPGACSTADITAFANYTQTQAFKSNQYSTATAPVSTTCKTCVSAEYNTAASPTSRPWGVSGLRTNAELTQYEPPSNRAFYNQYGCYQNEGVISASEARAFANIKTCLSFVCPTGSSGQACGAANSTADQACQNYALSSGACTLDVSLAGAAQQKINASTKCKTIDDILNAFCGTP